MIHYIQKEKSAMKTTVTSGRLIDFGAFGTVDLEDFHRYFVEFKRVLVPGGVVVVNFVNFMAPEGHAKFRRHAETTNHPDVFRWHHPNAIEALCNRLQFEQVELTPERVKAGDFVCYVSSRKSKLDKEQKD